MLKNLNLKRSALITAGLVFVLQLSLWAVEQYVAPGQPELASVLKHGLYDLAVAAGVVSNSRAVPKNPNP